MSETLQDIRQHIKVYMILFVVLVSLTLFSVAISYMHLSFLVTACLILSLAVIKAILVSGYFMHLISEKTFVYTGLILTVIFFLSVLVGPFFTHQEAERVYHVTEISS